MDTLMNEGERERGGFRVFDSGEIDSESDGGGLNQGLRDEQEQGDSEAPYHLEKFALFETASNFYMVGRDKERKNWRVLKIGRSEPSKLVIYEDPTIYSYGGCKLLLQDINEGNKLTGGHKFITTCYGIVGVIRFSGPYYIILITERREVGQVCGHPIYSISEYKMIPISNSTVWYMDNFEKENRYIRLLQLVDITKDFFFSYSYPIMHSLQKNLCQKTTGHSSDGTMFVWNEYLTHQLRNHLKNTLWTVALVHGFFKQVMLSESGKTFGLTLIARRSCHFAGTRYQKRGINEKGEAANDVEIEQIVNQKICEGCRYKITSVVQNRGSIPLCWSQNSSWSNLKPDILFSKGSNSYEATQLHFQNLHLRYGDHIIVLNLVKTCEKKRESLLRNKFGNAVANINKDSSKEYLLEFWSVDLDKKFQKQGIQVLTVLKEYATRALKQIGFFSCEIPQSITFKESFELSYSWINSNSANCEKTNCSDGNNNCKHQKGILRSNCLDSLDRTNVAQFVYSLVALGHQLYDLMITETPELDFNQTLAYDIMSLCQAMGDSLAQQYGGSAAHSKIFSAIRGQCKALTQLQEFTKTVQRHFTNSFWDIHRQKAIDMFLGHFQPEVGELAPMMAI